MDEVMVKVDPRNWYCANCMYSDAVTGASKLCSRSTLCAAPLGYVYMRPATALHFELTGEINHALDHNPQTTSTSIIR